MIEPAGNGSDDGPRETVAFLARTPTRVTLLRTVRDRDGCTRTALVDAVDADRTTVTRNLNALAERGLLDDERTGGQETWTATRAGRAILRDYERLAETIDVTRRLRPFLRWLPNDVDLDVRHLADAELTTATQNNPYATVNRHIRALRRATDVRLLLPVIGRDAMSVGVERIRADGLDLDVVVSRGAAEAMRSDPEFASLLEELTDTDVGISATDEEVPCYVGMFDDRVQIGVENDEGVPQALVETDAAPVRTWAVDLYESYRERAETIV